MKKIGVFGSAFDPPTRGHMDAILQVANMFDQIILIPSVCHAFGKKMQPVSVRLDMLVYLVKALAAKNLHCEITLNNIESLLRKGESQPVYTYDVLSMLDKKYKHYGKLTFIRGPDNAKNEVWQQFFKHADIEKNWSVITLKERLTIRSSMIRNLLNQDLPQKDIEKKLNELVIPEIGEYILTHALYKSPNQD